MGFSYLKDKQDPSGGPQLWSDITRDERYFCAELYFDIKQDLKEFLKWLKKRGVAISDKEIKDEWEIGFEVCFYRDYVKVIGDENNQKSIRRTKRKYSQKRTFDLCLFHEDRMIIIEAKAQKGFGTDQNEEFRKDIRNVLHILEKKDADFKVEVVALASSRYLKNKGDRGGLDKSIFSGQISWDDLYQSFKKNPAYLRADSIYKK